MVVRRFDGFIISFFVVLSFGGLVIFVDCLFRRLVCLRFWWFVRRSGGLFAFNISEGRRSVAALNELCRLRTNVVNDILTGHIVLM